MAPRKRAGGRSGLSFIFCCFNGNDPPEITYRLREDFTLTVMEPSLPMPGLDELDNMFAELVVSDPQTHRQTHARTHTHTLILPKGGGFAALALVLRGGGGGWKSRETRLRMILSGVVTRGLYFKRRGYWVASLE